MLTHLSSLIKSEYRSRIDDVITDFYIPLLSEAVSYKRAVGFFSSSSLVELSKGICALSEKGGKIQIVASPFLSDEDVDAIRRGYEQRNTIIERALLRSLDDIPEEPFAKERLNLLAHLIANDILDIRIAYTDDDRGMGMYHEKMGLIEDEAGNIVAFSGSMNETLTAMTINYETIDVFCSWKGEDDALRAEMKASAFYSIWNNYEKNIEVLEFPEVSKAIIKKFQQSTPSYDLDIKQFFDNDIDRFKAYVAGIKSINEKKYDRPVSFLKRPDDLTLYDYQEEAIENWVHENYIGIFDMATGTGKTLTGLSAIAKLAEDLNGKLAVFIVCPYQHLVEQWVPDIVRFDTKPIIAYSASPQKDWKQRLTKAIKDQSRRKEKPFFCCISTNATFSQSFIQEEIAKITFPILLVVDEAHNIGAEKQLRLLDERFTYRLALSATLERHHDSEGTEKLLSFFGNKCITYDLGRAIKEKKLTPYRYYPLICYLNKSELFEYEQLSKEMATCLISDGKGGTKLNSYGEMLAIKRSRVVAGAENKLDVLREAIIPYTDKNNILVYCGSTNVDYDNATTDDDPVLMRQIDAVTRLLGNEMDMKIARFTSAENVEERADIKKSFESGDRLQALVAIKCLDEGVNIPGIKTAFILASTTNPKEYIQRRGRVLRKFPGKEYAEIYDFITLPRPFDDLSIISEEERNHDLSLIKNELNRMTEFARLAENSFDSYSVIWDIKEKYKIMEEQDGLLKL